MFTVVRRISHMHRPSIHTSSDPNIEHPDIATKKMWNTPVVTQNGDKQDYSFC